MKRLTVDEIRRIAEQQLQMRIESQQTQIQVDMRKVLIDFGLMLMLEQEVAS